MGLSSVQYDLENWKGILASKCKLFCDIDTAFVPIGRIVVSGGLKAVLEYCSGIGEDFLEAVRSMLVFDAVIYNEDRHFGNFGILRDNHSGALIAPAPLFDHGLALFNYAMPEDIRNIDEYAKTRLPAYPGIKFEDICTEVMGKTQAQQLRRLIGLPSSGIHPLTGQRNGYSQLNCIHKNGCVSYWESYDKQTSPKIIVSIGTGKGLFYAGALRNRQNLQGNQCHSDLQKENPYRSRYWGIQPPIQKTLCLDTIP